MKKFIVLGGGWGQGYAPGTIIDAEDHAMADRVTKGEVAPYNEPPAPVEKKVVKPKIKKVIKKKVLKKKK